MGMKAIATIAGLIDRFESVRCLECGEVYAKPLAGGTVDKNPGCPLCGYVGWIPLNRPPELSSPRSGEGPPPVRLFPTG